MSNLSQFFPTNFPVGSIIDLAVPSGSNSNTAVVTISGQEWRPMNRNQYLDKADYPEYYALVGDAVSQSLDVTQAGTPGAVGDIAICGCGNSFIHLNSTSGPYYSNSNGVNWAAASAGLGWTYNGLWTANNRYFLGGATTTQLANDSGTTASGAHCTFTSRTFTSGPIVRDIAYNGANTYIAVGTSGTKNIGYSTDANGNTWTAISAADSNTYISCAWGNGKFVAISSAGVIKSSTDGQTWTQRTNPFPSAYNSYWFMVRYIKDRFIIFSTYTYYTYGARRSLYSLDGVTWTYDDHKEMQTPTNIELSGDVYAYAQPDGTSGNIWCAKSGQPMVSSDGYSWFPLWTDQYRYFGDKIGVNAYGYISARYSTGMYMYRILYNKAPIYRWYGDTTTNGMYKWIRVK